MLLVGREGLDDVPAQAREIARSLGVVVVQGARAFREAAVRAAVAAASSDAAGGGGGAAGAGAGEPLPPSSRGRQAGASSGEEGHDERARTTRSGDEAVE